MTVPNFAMSTIVYSCECGRTYNFRPKSAGNAEVCGTCQRPYFVPQPPETEDSSEFSPSDPGSTVGSTAGSTAIGSTAGSSPGSSANSNAHEIFYSCRCGNRIPFSAKFAGRRATCSSCKQTFVVPQSDPLTVPIPPPLPSNKPVVASNRLGDYVLRGAIGQGGMGKLRSAWDTRLQREVALKQIDKDSKRTSANARQRIIREARIAGLLTQPNIIPVYALEFDAQGEPFYTMPLLEGSNFAWKIKKYHRGKIKNVKLEELLRLFVKVCRAIAYAHSKQIVHRDIKPSNIHLDGFGEPFVIDWGLAKALAHTDFSPPEETETVSEEPDEEDVDLTLDGKLVGTTYFQSPEYRRTKTSGISDDLYALGVTLYYILCGRFPYSQSEIKNGNQKNLPKDPATLNSDVDRPLATICLKMLQYEAAKRYRSAGELADLLERWLNDEPMPGHTSGERWTRFLRKKGPPYYRMICGIVSCVAFVGGIVLAKLFC